MKQKLFLFLLIGLFFTQLNAQQNSIIIEDFIITDAIEVKLPLFADVEGVEGNMFEESDLLKYKYLSNLDFRPKVGEELEWSGLEFLKWRKSSIKDSIVSLDYHKGKFELAYAGFYLENDEWTKLELKIETSQMIEVYIDGKFIKGKYTFEEESNEKVFLVNKAIEANNHVVIIKMLHSDKDRVWTMKCEAIAKNESNSVALNSSIQARHYMDIDHLMNGVDIKNAKISPAGDYYFVSYEMQDGPSESQTFTIVKNIQTHKDAQVFNSDVTALQWSPKGNKLSYITKMGDKSWIWEHDLDNGKTYPILTELEEANHFQWSPNGEYLVLSTSEKPKKDPSGLKQLHGMPDHWSWYRNRSNLFLIDVLSGVKTPLTQGFQSNHLQDISQNGRYILFSQHIYDESERPYSKQIMMQYDRRMQKLDTLWNKFGSSNATYSPNGNQLLVTAGPLFFGEIGLNLSVDKIPNDYDTQAYIYTIDDANVKAISKEFNPNILSTVWNTSDPDHIYFSVSDRTYKNMYRYDIITKSYELLPLEMDVLNSSSMAIDKPLMIYYGNSISTPKQLYIYDISLKKSQLLAYPEEQFFDDILFGKTEEWNFVNQEGVTIEGRLYYPPNFEESKKYPLIVYYYGGTSPVERNFRGRYPKNLFAANGYIVYVIQPSGATGYGQEFSAKHVNNWGQTVADEIIQGSKELCKSHAFIDTSKVGCMGASYGGFMTMYLSTQTDFFSAHISHAGISSISSYWGEGYWGYLYSQVASANSFPWNNKELYVEQSPLFHADKVSSPILLLHGNSDTNVPPGESRQFYTALKLLKKDVELIEIDKQDHHIKDYKKRLLWQKTILAYFDKNLKKQTDWWYHLYPKKKL